MTWPNKSPEPTAVGHRRSAVAVHAASRRWLSFLRSTTLDDDGAITALVELVGHQWGFPRFSPHWAFIGKALRKPPQVADVLDYDEPCG